MSRYAQIPAPGCYVDTTRVGKTFTDLDRAVRAIRGNTRSVIRLVSDDVREGDRWFRVYEEGSPIVADSTGEKEAAVSKRKLIPITSIDDAIEAVFDTAGVLGHDNHDPSSYVPDVKALRELKRLRDSLIAADLDAFTVERDKRGDDNGDIVAEVAMERRGGS